MVKVITVHGTFAGDEADAGEKWWQQGSPFVEELQGYVEEPLEVEPFHWSGANSELDRRRAGYKLWKKVKSEKEPPIVIGHSHGGSIGIHAMAVALLKSPQKAFDMIRGFVTVGTPMILFEANRNPFTRFDIFGRLLLLYMLSILVWTYSNYFGQDAIVDSADRISATLRDSRLWISLGIILFLIAISIRSVRRRGLFAKNKLGNIFRSKYIPISHKRDEAINGLKRGKTLNPKIFSYRSTFVGVFSLLSFGILSLDVISDVIFTATTDQHYFTKDTYSTEFSRPITFLTDEPEANFGVPRASSSGFWYDTLAAKTFRTNQALLAIKFSEIWEEPAFAEILAKPENKWITAIIETHPPNAGYIFVEPLLATTLYEQLLYNVQLIAALGKEEFDRAVRCRYLGDLECSKPDPETPLETIVVTGPSSNNGMDLENPNGTPGYHVLTDLFLHQQKIESRLSGEGEPTEVYFLPLPRSLISMLPHSVFEPSISGGYLNRGSKFLGGKLWSSDLDSSACEGRYESTMERVVSLANSTGSFCPLMHPANDSVLRSFFYRFGEFKFSLNRFISNALYSLPIDIPDTIAILTGTTFFQVFTIIFLTGIASLALAAVVNPMLASTTTGSLRDTAFGNDGFGERVSDVKAGLDFSDQSVGTLPPDVEQEIINNSLNDAPAAIERLRMLLAGEGMGAGGVDPIAIATKFEQSELIHNAYFHSSAFTKYLAALMVEKFGLTPTSKLEIDQQAMAFRVLLSKQTSR